MKKIALLASFAIIAVLGVFFGVLAFGHSWGKAFIVGLIVFVCATFALAATVDIKVAGWRLLVVYIGKALSILGTMMFFTTISWWSAGIGIGGIAFTILFCKRCERYDHRHLGPITDTVHGDT